jgi:hypothetical protein
LRVKKYNAFCFVASATVLANTLYAFPMETYSAFRVLQSRLHDAWTRALSSTLETRLNYSATDCFDTFPFPKLDPRTVIPSLETIGQELYDARARFMVETDPGLTKTYNAIKDPACDDPRVIGLRRMHEAMDRAVLDAYGWTDVAVPPYCPATDADRAAVQAFEDEVIDRLYVLNAERAEEEGRLGMGGKKGKKAAAGEAAEPAKRRGKRAKADAASALEGDASQDAEQGRLF